MTFDHRLAAFLLSVKLGRLTPLWGIVETPDGFRCECGRRKEHKFGKHPRPIHGTAANWKRIASDDPGQIKAWLTIYPHCNFGIVAGERSIVLDADTRPESGKDGLRRLRDLGIEDIDTVVVASGRPHSKHFYFAVPDFIDILKNPFPDVELIKRGQTVAPGSRHYNGRYYTFEQSPSGELSPLPDFIIPFVVKIPSDMPTEPEIELPRSTARKAPSPGRRRPDSVVMCQLKRNPAMGSLYNGGRLYNDRSRCDHVMLCYLAFLTSHHWDQYARLWHQSPLRNLPDSKIMDPGCNETWTIQNAFAKVQKNWEVRKPRPAAQSANPKLVRKMRSKSEHDFPRPGSAAEAILKLSIAEPNLKPSQIASSLGFKYHHVYRTMKRYPHIS